jgi:hypothetical protein
MLLPVEAMVGWAVVMLVAAVLVRWSRKYWPIWCGLGVASCGAIYITAVMANRPPNYYALREWLASVAAISGGMVGAAVGVLWLLSPEAPHPSSDKHTAPGTSGCVG